MSHPTPKIRYFIFPSRISRAVQQLLLRLSWDWAKNSCDISLNLPSVVKWLILFSKPLISTNYYKCRTPFGFRYYLQFAISAGLYTGLYIWRAPVSVLRKVSQTITAILALSFFSFGDSGFRRLYTTVDPEVTPSTEACVWKCEKQTESIIWYHVFTYP